ncbi:hypothetical protein M569_15915, partial [Genlisea aurea]
WNSSKLRQVFSASDVRHILSIPLAKNAYPDRLIWHFSNHGNYTTKTGYNLLKGRDEMSRPSSSNTNTGCNLFWQSLWKVKLPVRILTFGWRFGKNILPLKDNLTRRKICLDSTCEICGEGRETWFHAFISCPFSQAVWRLGGTSWNITDQEPCHPLDWLMLNHQQLGVEHFSGLMVTLWCLSRHRLDYLHNQSSLDPFHTHQMIGCFIESSAVAFPAQHDPTPLPSLPQQRWEPPPVDFLKLNFDSGCCFPTGTGLGGSIWDAQGKCQAWFSYYHGSPLNPELGEALAARKILELAVMMKFTKVILEGDCLMVIQVLADRSSVQFSLIGNILQDSVLLMEKFEDCRLRHTRCEFNGAAHHLAK